MNEKDKIIAELQQKLAELQQKLDAHYNCQRLLEEQDAKIAKSLAEDPERWKSFQILIATELSFRMQFAFRDAGGVARLAVSNTQEVMQKTTQAIVKQIEACDTPEKLSELIKALSCDA